MGVLEEAAGQYYCRPLTFTGAFGCIRRICNVDAEYLVLHGFVSSLELLLDIFR